MSLSIKPILYKNRKSMSRNNNPVQVNLETIQYSDMKKEGKYARKKNYWHRTLIFDGDVRYRSFSVGRMFKNKQYRRTLDFTVSFHMFWSLRNKQFMTFMHNLRELQLLRKLTITIGCCLELPLAKYFLSQIRNLKYLTELRIELSRFYEIPLSFIKNLAALIQTFSKVKIIEVTFKRTPEMCFSDDLFSIFQAFSRLPHLQSLTFCFHESIQIKKFSQKEGLFKIFNLIKVLPVSSLSMSIKSNSLTEDSLIRLVKALAANPSLRKIRLELQDVENLLNVNLTTFLIEQINKNSLIDCLELKNTLQSASNNELELLNANILKFLACHAGLQNLNIELSAPSFFSGMKLAGAIASLSKLQALHINLIKPNDLILLQDLGKLSGLKDLRLFISFELDSSISGLLESLGKLSNLRFLNLEFKKHIPEMYFQKEDFKSLFLSLSQIKGIKEISLKLPIKEGSCYEESQDLTHLLCGASELEMFVLQTLWNNIKQNQLLGIFDNLFKKNNSRLEHLELHFGSGQTPFNPQKMQDSLGTLIFAKINATRKPTPKLTIVLTRH